MVGDIEDRDIDLAHSDRSKTPIEPYLADQWFVKMDELAQSAMDAVTDARVYAGTASQKDYLAGHKAEYQKAKERMADVLIRRAEKALLPGLASAIEAKEIGTPLTNLRYTGHYRGAIYGWDQTVNNSGSTRIGHATPIANLYLAGAWSRPGHGYGAVIPSGLECFAEIVRTW